MAAGPELKLGGCRSESLSAYSPSIDAGHNLIMERPFVSVVVPVLNRGDEVAGMLTALEQQDYESNRFEVVVVDNGSTDATIDIARRFDCARVLSQSKPGPYAARNAGIQAAGGEIIALLDGCPKKDWISRGAAAIEAGADLVCGRVQILPSAERTAAELADAITSIDGFHSVNRYASAPTANLFVRRSTFESLGYFDASVRSGGDILWTKAATDAGAKLVYDDQVVSTYRARKWRRFISKQWRIGLAQPRIWRLENRTASFLLKAVGRLFVPPNPVGLKSRSRRRSVSVGGTHRYARIWAVLYAAQIVRSVANLVGFAHILRARDDV